MKFSSFLTAIALMLIVTACSSGGDSGGKKLVIWSSGKIEQDPQNKTVINYEPGNRHNEMEIELGGNEKTVTLKTSSGDKTFEIPDNAIYLLNLKKDTIIGSQVNFGDAAQRTNIGLEELDQMIDSTQKLMNGENASDEKRSFWLPPQTIKKITTNLDATLLSTVKLIPYEVKPDEKGNAPEYYKFFTNSDKRESLKELIDRLSK